MEFDAEISKEEPKGFYEKYEPKETLGRYVYYAVYIFLEVCMNNEFLSWSYALSLIVQ